MATCRDWLSTLWSASFKGVPFYTEKTEQSGGRRLAVHTFPFRDDPFVEDMGEAPATFSVSAYVASDLADVEAGAFAAVLAADGPGVLVLPTHGPTTVRCQTFRREASKDKHGFIAFELSFVREGSAIAIASAPFLGQLVFAAVDVLAAAAVALFGRTTRVAGYADFVAEGASAAVQETAGAIDVIRTSTTNDATVSADVRDIVTDVVVNAPTMINRLTGVDASAADQIITAARTLSGGMTAEAAVSSFAAMFDAYPPDAVPAVETINQAAAREARSSVARIARIAALCAYAEAMARREFKTRPEGITARADVVELFDVEIGRSDDADTAVALQNTRGAIVAYLSRTITTLAPIVTVEAPRNMPALWWAHRLYGDPLRATELVERNGVRHPQFMPTTFEALAT